MTVSYTHLDVYKRQVKEIAVPAVQLWPLIKIPEFGNIWNQLSPFAIGWPSAATWIAAIPTAIVVYIIAFGDFVTSEELLRSADEVRQDEKIEMCIRDREYTRYTTDAYANALCALVEKYGPTSMLIGATNNGRDLGPRVSCRLKTGLTADCTGLDIDEESGNVAWTRPAFGGNLMATILCPDHRPQIGTVRPGVFKKSEPSADHQAEDVYKRQVAV